MANEPTRVDMHTGSLPDSYSIGHGTVESPQMDSGIYKFVEIGCQVLWIGIYTCAFS